MRDDKNPIVVWLYKKGGLLKQYPLSFFVKKPALIRYSSCATAFWFEQENANAVTMNEDGVFYFKTIDGVRWGIKASTGAATQSK
ncbi:MAG: hypothetical protein WAQ53_03185 [Thiofilum sp.]|uniref:hypothetical protein n=1 Tax=Thiofilum sp. TaxID=2212733 RepID=UPI0025D421BA|nr:hypothetical protein [Thiofilum sp.]MBK8454694.1 hypothetical protein [Thiofilum sp.]